MKRCKTYHDKLLTLIGKRIGHEGWPFRERSGTVIAVCPSGGLKVKWDNGKIGYAWQRWWQWI